MRYVKSALWAQKLELGHLPIINMLQTQTADLTPFVTQRFAWKVSSSKQNAELIALRDARHWDFDPDLYAHKNPQMSRNCGRNETRYSPFQKAPNQTSSC